MPYVEPHFRECMLYEFDLKHNAAEATCNICAAYCEDAPTLRTCQHDLPDSVLAKGISRMSLVPEGRSSSIKKLCEL